MDEAFSYSNFTERTKLQSFIIVFFIYLAAGVGAEYLYFSFGAAPTVFWFPAGIALGFLLVWGYEQWIPVAAAQCITPLLAMHQPNVIFALINTGGFTGQALLGAYFLRETKFNGMIAHTRDALLLVAVAFGASMVAPSVASLAGWLFQVNQTSIWTQWMRVWVGSILGTLLITPFITSWFPSSWDGLRELKWIESAVALVTVMAITYVLFWTTLLGSYSFIFIYFFLAAFFWMGYRLQPRVMMLSLFFTTAFGVTGTFIYHPAATSLSQQLFADQLFFILVIPIFLIMAVLVTERRIAMHALEREKKDLAEALAKLSEQDRSKNEFISIFAHELRNPLAPIASTLEFLRLNERDPENIKAVEVADQQVRIVRRLLDDLLDVARITQKKFNLQRETVALENIIQPAVAAVRAFFESRDHSFWFSLPDEDVFVNVDTARMIQAIMNILFNAGKYTPPGGTIELLARREGDDIEITIQDNGVGIGPDMLSLIFEPFQQAYRGGSAAAGGTGLGLGLFIAKQLVVMHGGELSAKSDGINRGTSFTICLPLVKSAPKFKPADPFALPVPQKRLYILVVDDNQAAAQALQKLLTLRGHSVRVAHTGEAALRAIEGHPPEVVLLDIGLPDINGYELAREIKRRGLNMALIALTGYGQNEDRLKSKDAGFDYHLTKPIGLAELEKVFMALQEK